MNVGSIGEYIRQQREQAKISLRQLASAAGVSNPYLSQIERGLRRPSAEILQQIAKGLRISAEALYVQAGILEDREPDSGVRAAVLAAPDLTERQKQVLLEIYESFRQEMSVTAEVISVRARAVSESVPAGAAADSEGTSDSAAGGVPGQAATASVSGTASVAGTSGASGASGTSRPRAGAAAPAGDTAAAGTPAPGKVKASSSTETPGKNGVRSKPARSGRDSARSGTVAARTRTRASAASGTGAPDKAGAGGPVKAKTAPEDGSPGRARAAS